MAKFQTTEDINASIARIIREAEKELVLVSPYLKFSDRLKGHLEDKLRVAPDLLVQIVYGKRKKLDLDVSEWLRSWPKVKKTFRKNLHAKCYLNEEEAIVTSMNLYEYSQQNNDEMGILVSQEEDTALYEDIREEAERIGSLSEPEKPPKPPRPKARAATKPPVKGFCIRCKTEISAKPMEPYCKRLEPYRKGCYTIWNRFKNKDFKEKHCHTCGKEHEATMKKPVCLDCFHKYKNVLEFATG